MSFFFILFAVASFAGFVGFAFLWWQSRRAARLGESELRTSQDAAARLRQEIGLLQAQVARLGKWTSVANAEDKAREILAAATEELKQAERDAEVLIRSAEQQYKALIGKARVEAAAETSDAYARSRETISRAEGVMESARTSASQIVAAANARAQDIAGEALEAVRNAATYERIARAMQHKIEGYGDEYLLPAESLLDELAEDFGHKDAGKELKLARLNSRVIMKERRAGACDYVEAERRKGAEDFVVDAFNGKVDSILSRAKHDNHGKLAEEIRDAFSLVNANGRPFRNARVSEEFLNARLAELKWATIAFELKRQDAEEQRRLREQIREEEKARRDYERAIREAQRDEDALRQALFKAQAQVESATEAQRAKYEAQLADLNTRLKAAEERNQRALSMAQQTRRGHVYIISNVGSFGENVYKIGLTRRLDPLDRIWELGDASVPFDFDVHAVILSEDAPALEGKLHRHFLLNQINKANHRKEFFRADLAEIRSGVEGLGVTCNWTMTAEAREYRETQAIERIIQADPAARSAWCNRQLRLDTLSSDAAKSIAPSLENDRAIVERDELEVPPALED